MQLLAPLAGGKGMSSASHIAEELVGGAMYGGGRRSAGRSDTLSTELCPQRVRKRDAENKGRENLGSIFVFFFVYC